MVDPVGHLILLFIEVFFIILQFLIPHSENVSLFLFSQQALRCRRTAAPRSRPPWRWWSPRRRGWPTPPQLRRWPRPRWRSPRWRVDVRERDHTSSNPETWTSWRPPASERRRDGEAARTLKVLWNENVPHVTCRFFIHEIHSSLSQNPVICQHRAPRITFPSDNVIVNFRVSQLSRSEFRCNIINITHSFKKTPKFLTFTVLVGTFPSVLSVLEASSYQCPFLFKTKTDSTVVEVISWDL